MRYKRCARCKQVKPLDGFGQYGASKDGKRSWCKVCHNEYNKRYSGTRKQYEQRYYQEHKEHLSQMRKARKHHTKEEVLTYYGNGKLACVLCGETRLACLSIDHIEVQPL